MNKTHGLQALEQPLASLPHTLRQLILERIRNLTHYEPVIGIMGIAPYRLVLHDGNWYLTGAYQSHIIALPLTDIRAVTLHPDSFTPDATVRDILSRPDFLQALPHFHVFHSLFVNSNGQLPHKEQV